MFTKQLEFILLNKNFTILIERTEAFRAVVLSIFNISHPKGFFLFLCPFLLFSLWRQKVIPIIFKTNTTSPSDFVYPYTSPRNLLIPLQLKGSTSLISSLLPLPWTITNICISFWIQNNVHKWSLINRKGVISMIQIWKKIKLSFLFNSLFNSSSHGKKIKEETKVDIIKYVMSKGKWQ